MDFQSIIATKRDGKRHSKEQLTAIAEGAARGTIPDYQLSAWLMAAYLNPLDEEETAWLTLAMAESGERVDLTGLPKPWVDKHSTGGVGDKTTLVLLPLLAACGLTVVKMSGRGLGITGGTIDKLGSVPGFRLDLTPEEMKAQAGRIGLALTGQTPNLAPADKALYAIRDVTGTVTSIPLIVSSILSKKLAGGAETIVLDVKCGSGAFMTDAKRAEELARMLIGTSRYCGLKVRAAITDMNQPLGMAVGNALEVAEAASVLSNGRLTANSERFRELCVGFAALTLEATGLESKEDARVRVEQTLASGLALEKAEQWFVAQGADPAVLHDPSLLPQAPLRETVEHTGEAGWISRVDAATVGRAVIAMGGGRQRKEDPIDPRVGVELHCQVGDSISPGDPLFTIHAADQDSLDVARERLTSAVELAPMETPRHSLFLTTL